MARARLLHADEKPVAADDRIVHIHAVIDLDLAAVRAALPGAVKTALPDITAEVEKTGVLSDESRAAIADAAARFVASVTE